MIDHGVNTKTTAGALDGVFAAIITIMVLERKPPSKSSV
jgi:uncharacterized membrane protein